MRIATDNMFQQELSWITNQYQTVARLNTQAASGKNLIDNSDDPVLASRIALSNDYLAQITSYNQNLIIADSRAKLFEASMSDAVATVDQIKQVISRAGGINNDAQRSALASQLSGYLNVLLNDANTRDSTGEYIYSGYNTSVAAYTLQGSSYTYQGTNNQTTINISDNVSTVYNESGFNVFGQIPNGNGTFTVNGSSTNTGTASASSGSVVDQASYVEDTYTISFVTTGSGSVKYTISGAASGQVVPPLPGTVPTDAPDYVPDSDISFNGMSIHFRGDPQPGDSFTVAPSQNKNVFNSVTDLMNLLNTPIGDNPDPVKLADFHTKLSQLSSGFSNVFDHLVANKSIIGTREQVIINQKQINSSLVLAQTAIYGQLSDVNLEQVTADIAQNLVYLQATQSCYVQIQSTLLELLKF